MTTPKNYSILTVKCKDYGHSGYVADSSVEAIPTWHFPIAPSHSFSSKTNHTFFLALVFSSLGSPVLFSVRERLLATLFSMTYLFYFNLDTFRGITNLSINQTTNKLLI